jgi:excisionase family DNA binding protein
MGNTKDDGKAKFQPELDDIRAAVREELQAARRKDAAPEPLLTKKDAAEVLGVSPRTVDTLIHSGELPSLKVRRRRRIRPADLEAYIAANAGGDGR